MPPYVLYGVEYIDLVSSAFFSGDDGSSGVVVGIVVAFVFLLLIAGTVHTADLRPPVFQVADTMQYV